MGELIDIDEFRPHAHGEAFCLNCKHEWVAVMPVGTTWMECPKCGLYRGRFKYAHVRSDDLHWECRCGNNLFYAVSEGIYCPNCGSWQKFIDHGP